MSAEYFKNVDQRVNGHKRGPGFDKSSDRVAPCRRIEVRENHQGSGFLLVAVTERPDAGKKETLLNVGSPLISKAAAFDFAEYISRGIEHVTGILYAY